MRNRKTVTAFCASAMSLSLAFPIAAFAQGTVTAKAVAPAHQRTRTVVAENEKLLVAEIAYQPGDMGPASLKDGIVVYHVHGGTMERTYADGSKTVVIYKSGETSIIAEKRPYATKNIGKTVIHEIAVQLK